MEKIKMRPLGTVRELVEIGGYEITYFYDDLVFGDNNMFILQFDDNSENRLYLHINETCEEGPATKLQADITKAGDKVGFQIVYKGKYSITQKEENEELDITFGD